MAEETDQEAREDDQIVHEDDLAMPESTRPGRDGSVSLAYADVAPAGLEPPASVVYELPGSAPHGEVANQPGMGESNAGDQSPSPVVAVVASSVAEGPLSGTTTTTAWPWSEIQATFVDDPRASIELAAGLVDDRLGALATSVRSRQQSLRSAWQGEDAGTEEMRVTLKHYRAFWHRLEVSRLNEHTPAERSRSCEDTHPPILRHVHCHIQESWKGNKHREHTQEDQAQDPDGQGKN
jgi:hypothetical protein